jgi:hypothetical protein
MPKRVHPPRRLRATLFLGLLALGLSACTGSRESAPAPSPAPQLIVEETRAAVVDRTAPSEPGDVRVVGRTRTSITIAWSPSSDDVGVAGYGVFVGKKRVDVVPGQARTYTFRGLACDPAHALSIDARDAAGHRSARTRILGTTRVCAGGSAPVPPLPPAPSPPAARATLFVAPDGSDDGTCTRAAPCASLDRAYQVASPGETVEIAGGSYPSQTINSKPKMRPPFVVFKEAPGARVIIGDRDATIECLAFEGSQYVRVEGVETTYTTVGGLEHQCGVTIGRSNAHHITLVNVDAGMIWFGADDVRILGGDYGPGIDEVTKIEFATGHPPRNILIDGATIHDQRPYLQHPECIALWGGERVTIRNSHLYNCGAFHIFLTATDTVISDVLIEGNTFTQPATLQTSSTIKVGDHGGPVKNVVLRGNRVLYDEVFIAQGFGQGGTGDIHLFDNRVVEAITLGSRQNCMRNRSYQPKPQLRYWCRGNRLVSG